MSSLNSPQVIFCHPDFVGAQKLIGSISESQLKNSLTAGKMVTGAVIKQQMLMPTSLNTNLNGKTKSRQNNEGEYQVYLENRIHYKDGHLLLNYS